MKRRISLLCAVLLLMATILSAFAPSMVAADYSSFTVALEVGEVQSDRTFVVDVMVYNNPGISGYKVSVGFDNSQIEYVDVVRDSAGNPKSVFPTTPTLNVAEPGFDSTDCNKVTAVAARSDNSTKNGALVSVIFKLCEGVDSADLYLEDTQFANTDHVGLYPDLVNATVFAPSFTASLEAREIEDDGTVIVDVVIKNNPGISGYEYRINFDNTKIQIVDVVRDEDDVPESVFPAEATLNIDEGGVDLADYSVLQANAARAKAYMKDGIFLSIIFKFLEGEYSADLSFSDVMFVNQDNDEVSVTVKNLSVSRPEPDEVGYCGDEVTYEFFRDTGLLKIKGVGEMWDFSHNDTPWDEYKNEIINAKIGNGVTSVGDRAFSKCENLVDVVISESVERIGAFAFADSGLVAVEIPGSVTVISDNAFQACYKLNDITVAAENATYSSVDGVLFSKDMKTLVAYPAGRCGEYVIPSGVVAIGDYAFIRCINLANVIIPDSVKVIGKSAFSGCEGLVNVDIPVGVVVLADSVFSFCTGLESITIPGNVTKIGNMAFDSCSGLTSIVIPESVESIGALAFQYCEGLDYVVFNSKTVTIGSMAFSNCGLLDTIYCYRESTADMYFGDDYTKLYMDVRTVTYDLDGGEGEFAPQSKMGYENIVLYSQIPERFGYIFVCWNGSDGNTYNAGDEYTGIADLTLTAQWKMNIFTITYNANGGDGVPADQTKTAGVDVVLSNTIPTRNGYSFMGWATSPDGAVVYAPGDVYSKNESIVLYAVWAKITYGDCNGDDLINAKDAVLLAQYLAGWSVKIELYSADCNGDGLINAKDTVLLAQYLAGWAVTLG